MGFPCLKKDRNSMEKLDCERVNGLVHLVNGVGIRPVVPSDVTKLGENDAAHYYCALQFSVSLALG